MNKRKAKVWTQTKGTLAIALPKDWCNFNHPKEVEMIYNGSIIIFGENTPPEERDRLIKALQNK